MTGRTAVLTLALAAIALPLAAQQPARATWREPAIHYGKWLTAGATIGLTFLAQREHRQSRRDWDDLLAICRSAEDACALGTDGRYIRNDAEFLYERSRY